MTPLTSAVATRVHQGCNKGAACSLQLTKGRQVRLTLPACLRTAVVKAEVRCSSLTARRVHRQAVLTAIQALHLSDAHRHGRHTPTQACRLFTQDTAHTSNQFHTAVCRCVCHSQEPSALASAPEVRRWPTP